MKLPRGALRWRLQRPLLPLFSVLACLNPQPDEHPLVTGASGTPSAPAAQAQPPSLNLGDGAEDVPIAEQPQSANPASTPPSSPQPDAGVELPEPDAGPTDAGTLAP